jgi:uncharacterized protein YbdZ (MbtH family)
MWIPANSPVPAGHMVVETGFDLSGAAQWRVKVPDAGGEWVLDGLSPVTDGYVVTRSRINNSQAQWYVKVPDDGEWVLASISPIPDGWTVVERSFNTSSQAIARIVRG